MFLGHFAVAFAAKRAAPRASLGALFLAAQWLDLVWLHRARGRAGRLALSGLVAALAAIYAADVLGPPPPSAKAIGAAGLLLWLFVPWAGYVDRRRSPAAGPSARTAAPLLG